MRLIFGELRINLLDALDVDLRGLGVVHHGHGVVAADEAARRLLHRLGRHPRLVDVAGRHVP